MVDLLLMEIQSSVSLFEEKKTMTKNKNIFVVFSQFKEEQKSRLSLSRARVDIFVSFSIVLSFFDSKKCTRRSTSFEGAIRDNEDIDCSIDVVLFSNDIQ